jgi:hypothetical protein
MSEDSSYGLVALKKWWVPEWLFTFACYACRFIESDLAECPRLRRWLTTTQFHYHDLGGPIFGVGEKCLLLRKQEAEDKVVAKAL